MSARPERALVTGATGFVGRHLVALLLRQGYQVVALTAPADAACVALPDAVECLPCEVRDSQLLRQILRQVAPEVIFHLAGLARGDDMHQLVSVNVLGTEALLQTASELAEPPRIVIPGSAAEYGLLESATPVHEATPLRPVSAYGISKVAQTLLGQSYTLRGKAPVIIGRVFNIVGPGEPSTMVCGHVASQIAACEVGRMPPRLSIGSLAATRDFLDVRDVVRALLLLSDLGCPGEVYNVCSGIGQRMSNVVQQLVGLSSVPIALPPDVAKPRPTDVPYCVGDGHRLQAATGFAPSIPLAQSLRDLLAGWRQAWISAHAE